MLRPETLLKYTHKTKRENLANELILRFCKKSNNMPCVVFDKESKDDRGFEIKHQQQMLVYAQSVNLSQFSCSLLRTFRA